jgi:predicted MFS family arabinose efflux permease
MPALKITPQQFGTVVSAYAFSAGVSGFLAAGFADKFDRKKLLVFFYCGFILGTLLCGVAKTYEFLLFARIVTGVFGGVIGSITLAIATDLFAFEQRGRVMGIVQTAFSASQVLGLPLALYLSNHLDWHAPFLFIVAFGIVVGIFIIWCVQPIDAHLKIQRDHNALQHLIKTVSNPRHIQGFLAIALLATGGFMIMPFASAYTVHNLGIDMNHLPMVYLVTGICSIFVGPLVGRASDKFGKIQVFTFGTVLSIIMVFIYTHLGVSPLWLVIVVNSVMFVGIFSRIIPSQALMSAVPEPANRGAFMSVNSSVQQIAGGLSSFISGMIVVETASGEIQHFDVVGYVVAGAAVFTLLMMYRINKMVGKTAQKTA